MSNPIFSNFGSNNPMQQAPVQNNSNDLISMINTVRNSTNPNQAMQQMLSSNPEYQNVMDYIRQNGGDAKTAFYNMAAQKGVDPNSILSNPIMRLLR